MAAIFDHLDTTVILSRAQAGKGIYPSVDPLASGSKHSGYPPLLNVAPPAFLRAFARHYLYAALHALFYESLMAENRQRMQQMEQAVRRIDEESRALGRKRHGLRREEITEEIEVIMLNAEALNLAPEDA